MSQQLKQNCSKVNLRQPDGAVFSVPRITLEGLEEALLISMSPQSIPYIMKPQPPTEVICRRYRLESEPFTKQGPKRKYEGDN